MINIKSQFEVSSSTKMRYIYTCYKEILHNIKTVSVEF